MSFAVVAAAAGDCNGAADESLGTAGGGCAVTGSGDGCCVVGAAGACTLVGTAAEIGDGDVAATPNKCAGVGDLTAVALAAFSLGVSIVRGDGCSVDRASSAAAVAPAASVLVMICAGAACASETEAAAATCFLGRPAARSCSRMATAS